MPPVRIELTTLPLRRARYGHLAKGAPVSRRPNPDAQMRAKGHTKGWQTGATKVKVFHLPGQPPAPARRAPPQPAPAAGCPHPRACPRPLPAPPQAPPCARMGPPQVPEAACEEGAVLLRPSLPRSPSRSPRRAPTSSCAPRFLTAWSQQQLCGCWRRQHLVCCRSAPPPLPPAPAASSLLSGPPSSPLLGAPARPASQPSLLTQWQQLFCGSPASCCRSLGRAAPCQPPL